MKIVTPGLIDLLGVGAPLSRPIVREAIDAAFPDDGPDRAEAARRVLDAEPIPVSDWPLIKHEIDQMHEPVVG